MRPVEEYGDRPSSETLFREQWGRVVAALIGFLGDFDLAEEAAQEAFAIAAERWPATGCPANPRAWLVATARNRAIDRVRRDRTLAGKTSLLHGGARPTEATDGTTTTACSPTSASSSSSRAAIRRSPSKRRWP